MVKFSGPVFIVGMPRSGTKLLRNILNNHAKIVFPKAETEFLPYLNERFNGYGDLKDYDNFKIFYEDVVQNSFFSYMNEFNENAFPIRDKWFNASNSGKLEDIFEALIRVVMEVESSSDIIWGDKSPSYIRHVPLLMALYPKCKIIHIVRDVRDYCLSINNAWGKNMFRAAQRWHDDTKKVSDEIKQISDENAIEIRYEDLLNNPKKTILDICNFIGITFDSNMLKLAIPSENIGDTKGCSDIVVTNQEKWRSKLDEKTLRRIESISFSQLCRYGYKTDYVGSQTALSRFDRIIYQIIDGWKIFIYDRDDRGLWKNLLFIIQSFRVKK